jgi:hypothetical protein
MILVFENILGIAAIITLPRIVGGMPVRYMSDANWKVVGVD